MADAPEMLIVADDLSGAADCAIACLAAGLRTCVVLDGDERAPVAQALAIDTDSRRLAGDSAAAVTARMIESHAGAGTLVYKKIDSTVRGNLAVEIAASVAALRRRHERPVAIVAPAFPAAGRTTRGGHQYLHGETLEATEIWRNEGITGRAHVPAMLEAAGLRAIAITLEQVRGGGLGEILARAGAGHDALVCDAETDEDLRAIAGAGQHFGGAAVWCGSAGLARYLPEAAGLRGDGASETGRRREGAIICAVGSLSSVSRAQFLRLPPEAGITGFIIRPEVLAAGPASELWAAQSGAIHTAVAAGQDIAVMIDSGEAADPREGLKLVAGLARLLAPHLGNAGGLIATGGETARALLLAAGVAALNLAAEIEPGIPLSYAAGFGGDARLPVITKAGAFGNAETLLRCRNLLRAGGDHNEG